MGKSIFTNEYQTILRKLRQARVDARITQTGAARKLKKPQSFVSKVESGERRIDVVELKSFARLYKKPLSFFIQ